MVQTRCFGDHTYDSCLADIDIIIKHLRILAVRSVVLAEDNGRHETASLHEFLDTDPTNSHAICGVAIWICQPNSLGVNPKFLGPLQRALCESPSNLIYSNRWKMILLEPTSGQLGCLQHQTPTASTPFSWYCKLEEHMDDPNILHEWDFQNPTP